MTIDDLRKKLREYCQLLEIPEDKTEKILNHEYTTLTLGRWKPKTRKAKEGLQLQGVLEGKKLNLKNTTREELFTPMRELVKLYKAYKFLTEDWQEVKEILRRETPYTAEKPEDRT